MTASAWWTSFSSRARRRDNRRGGGFFLADAIRSACFLSAAAARVFVAGGAAIRAAARVFDRVLFAGAVADTGVRSTLRRLRRRALGGVDGVVRTVSTLGSGWTGLGCPWFIERVTRLSVLLVGTSSTLGSGRTLGTAWVPRAGASRSLSGSSDRRR